VPGDGDADHAQGRTTTFGIGDEGTQPASALEAEPTAPAGIRRVDRDPPAVARAALDDPDQLVTGHERSRERALADRSVLEPVAV